MAQDNLSAVLYGKDDLRMEQREIPVAKNGELLIRSDIFKSNLFIVTDCECIVKHTK